MSKPKYTRFFLLSMTIFLLVSTSSAVAKTSDPLEILIDNGLQIYPSAVWNSERGEYLTVWYNEYADSNSGGIYGMHIDPNGTKGDLFKIDSIIDTEDTNHSPQIAYDSSKDQYLITWHDKTSDSLSIDICAALVSFNENDGQIKILNIPKVEERQLHPKVAWNGEQFLIVWYDFRNGTFLPQDLKDADIYGVRLDPNGNVLDPDGLAICTDDSGQVDPVVAGYSAEGEKGWLVGWVDERNTSSGKDIYAAIVNRNGDLVKQSFSISTAEKDQKNVQLAVGPSGFFMVWHDESLKGTQDQEGNILGNHLFGVRLSWDGDILTDSQNRTVIPIAMVESGIFDPSSAYFHNNFLVTWHDDSKIKGARVSWEGYVFLGSIDEDTGEQKPFILSDPNTVSTNSAVAVTYSSTGDYNPDEKVLVTWQVDDDTTSQDIWGALYTPPKPPLLQWVGTVDFTEDGVHPGSGEGGDVFTFKVRYEKSEEGYSTPLLRSVWIDRNRDGKLEMDEIFQMAADEEDSSIYQTELAILYEYDGDPNDPDKNKVTYRFYFQDEFNMAIGDPNAEGDPAGEHSITVTEKGSAPQLSWLGTGGYIQDGLDPDIVEVDTNNTFIFKVQYRDSNGDEPEIHQVWIDINRDNSFAGIWTDYDRDGIRDENEIISEKFDMEEESGGDYSTGITYSFEKDLVVNKIGPLGYRFYFDDGANVARGEPKNIHYLVITGTSEDCIYSGFKPQMGPDIALTDQGGLIVWQDLRNGRLADPNIPQIAELQWFYQGAEIYGLLLDPENETPGTENGREIQIGTPNKNQFNPRIAGWGNRFLVVWEDLRDGEIVTTGSSPGYENKDIYGQIIDSKDPNNRIEDFPIATYTTVEPDDPSYMDQSNPAVATSEDNRFLVVWEDGRGGSSWGKDIYGSIVSYDPNVGPKVDQDADGYGLDSCIIHNSEEQTYPAVAWANNARRYLVVWQHSGASSLWANSLDPNGQVMGGWNILKDEPVDKEYNREHGNPICTDRDTDMYSPAIASDGDRFLIVWEHEEEGILADKDIYGIFVNSDSIVILVDPNGKETQKLQYISMEPGYIGEAKIAICTAKGDQTNPRVHWDKATGNYFVVWTSQPLYKNAQGEYEPGSDTDIRGAWLNANGQLIGREFEDSGWEICAVQGIQEEPAISGNGAIKRAVWTDYRNNGFPRSSFIFDGLSSDIYTSPLKSFLQPLDDEDFLTGVNPTIGGNGTKYTFKINYLDIAEDPNNLYEDDPNICQVWIDLDGDGKYDSGERHTMTADPNDKNLGDGQIYATELSLTLPDDYNVTYWPIMIGYRFYFEDKAGFSPIGSANIQKTFQMNPPLLSWTREDNYHNSGVYPSSGQKDAAFEFRVLYQYVNPSDSDEKTSHPDAELWIDFNQDGDYEEDNEKFGLTPESDGNYAEGKIFSYTLEGWHREGTYNYRFYFQHIKGGFAVGEPTKNHQFSIYEPREKGWRTYTTDDGLAGNYILSLLAQGDTLWVVTGSSTTAGTGLNRFRNESWETISELEGYDILTMVLDSTEHVVYFGTYYGGLRSYNGSSWTHYGNEETKGVFNKEYILIRYLAFDKIHHRIWMYVTQASPKSSEDLEIDPNSKEYSLVRADIAEGSWTKYTKEEISSHIGGEFPFEGTQGLTVDNRGDVWASIVYIVEVSETESKLEDKRLLRFNPDEKKWTHYTIASDEDNILETDIFWKIQGDDDGYIWCGGAPLEEGKAEQGGLYQFDIEKNKWINHFSKGQSGVNLGTGNITALCKDSSDLWVGTGLLYQDGTYDGGASAYDGSSWGDLFTTVSTGGGLVCNAITAIAVQRSDLGEEIWFGTPKGLSRYGYGGQYTPADPNTVFRFPDRGCFTDSFGNLVNHKSMLNHNPLGFWWIFLIMSFLCLGVGFFSIVRRYVWVRRE